MAEKEKKVIIDSDWKAQAQAEKEKAQAEIEAEKQTPELPKGDFPSLVSMLATQAYYAMGLIGNPNDPKKPELNLEMARYIIDVLSTLEEKTKGNLTDEETTFFQSTLNQLRMIFVKISES